MAFDFNDVAINSMINLLIKQAVIERSEVISIKRQTLRKKVERMDVSSKLSGRMVDLFGHILVVLERRYGMDNLKCRPIPLPVKARERLKWTFPVY